MNMKLFSTALAVTVALFAALMGGCGQKEDSQAEKEPTEVVEQQDDQQEPQAEKDTLAEGPDVEGETEEQAAILERSELAEDFVRTWGTTTNVDPNDDTIVSNIDDWFEKTLAFVRPDSQLYADFMKRDQYEGPGFVDAATIVKDVQVTGHDGDTYTVVATMAGTQSGFAGWTQETYELTHEITFDADNYVVRVDQWG
ncbi:MAG: hypothetical protein IJ092_04750 [Atopobiaceae bacterium]|nr:hypothetical protein [Atopobiaceae bacterium]MBR1828662.1 hypothetical protein [Atopobiaceae bacterium]